MGRSSHSTTDRETQEAFESPPRSLEKGISSGCTVMVCDSPPLDGRARAAGFLDIRGWAYSRAGLDDVLVYLDGLRYQARLGGLREDLGGQFGVDLTRSGFGLTIELDADQAGQLPVTVVARGANGHVVGVRGTVDCRPEPELPVAPRGGEDGTGQVDAAQASALGASANGLAWSLQERARIAQAEASASEAEARAARVEAARSLRLLQRAEDRRRAVETSLSWRITRPLRRAERVLRFARRALRPARRVLGSARHVLRSGRRALRRRR